MFLITVFYNLIGSGHQEKIAFLNLFLGSNCLNLSLNAILKTTNFCKFCEFWLISLKLESPKFYFKGSFVKIDNHKRCIFAKK